MNDTAGSSVVDTMKRDSFFEGVNVGASTSTTCQDVFQKQSFPDIRIENLLPYKILERNKPFISIELIEPFVREFVNRNKRRRVQKKENLVIPKSESKSKSVLKKKQPKAAKTNKKLEERKKSQRTSKVKKQKTKVSNSRKKAENK